MLNTAVTPVGDGPDPTRLPRCLQKLPELRTWKVRWCCGESNRERGAGLFVWLGFRLDGEAFVACLGGGAATGAAVMEYFITALCFGSFRHLPGEGSDPRENPAVESRPRSLDCDEATRTRTNRTPRARSFRLPEVTVTEPPAVGPGARVFVRAPRIRVHIRPPRLALLPFGHLVCVAFASEALIIRRRRGRTVTFPPPRLSAVEPSARPWGRALARLRPLIGRALEAPGHDLPRPPSAEADPGESGVCNTPPLETWPNTLSWPVWRKCGFLFLRLHSE